MNICENFAALLDPFIDGELSQEEADRVRAHLAQCPACQTYVTDAFVLRDAFPDVEDTVLPENFTANVMAAVAASPRKSGKKTASPWRKVLLPLAACFALVVLVQRVPLMGMGGDAAAESASPAAAYDTVAEDCAVAEEADELMKTTSFTGAVDTPAAAAPEAKTEPAFDAAAQEAENGSAILYATRETAHFVTVRLTAEEAGDLLDGFAPLEETETEILYALTEPEYASLLTALAERGVTPAETVENTTEDGAGTALVILER